MKKIQTLIASFLMLTIGFTFTSCEPDTYSLGKTPDKSQINFDIVQDFTVDPGGNTVIMTNKTPGVVLTWDYGTGRSNKQVETVRYAFKGDYTINITAVTAGGTVELDPVTITVTEDNLNYVNDPLWTLLSGGVGNSKTWLLDVDSEGVSKYFTGPMFFYGTENGWLEGGDNGCYGTDCWNWSPDLGSILGWGFSGPADFGEMTFSLDGGPNLYVNHLNLPQYGMQSGTYFLDSDNHTINTTGATVLHDSAYEDCVDDWNSLVLFSLTEDTMQLGVLRKDSCGGSAMLVYNFISKEYSDNWVPEDLPDPNPPIDLDGGTVGDLLSTTTTTTKTWYLSPDTPFNWTDLNGAFLNNWNSVEDYEAAGWPAYTSADQTTVINNKITFANDGTVTTIDSNGVEMAGNYSTTTDGTNIIQFTDITPYFPIGNSWATVATTSQNQWKIIKTGSTDGVVTDIWFGKRDETGKDEYMVFHFVLDDSSVGGGGSAGTVVAFDNSKFAYGDLEGNGNFRLEFYNEYGPTVTDPPLNPDDIAFGGSMDITFTLSGITLVSGATASYTADYQFASDGWGFQYWGEGTKNSGDTSITGDGTYTVTFTPGQNVSGPIVFVIDIFGLGADIEDISAVTATIDSIIIK